MNSAGSGAPSSSRTETRTKPPDGTVIFDEEENVFNMWYRIVRKQEQDSTKTAEGGYGVCYAVSKNRIHWEKPKLGLSRSKASAENVRDFVKRLRELHVTPHVAQKNRSSAIDWRTSRHGGYMVSQLERPAGRPASGGPGRKRGKGLNKLTSSHESLRVWLFDAGIFMNLETLVKR